MLTLSSYLIGIQLDITARIGRNGPRFAYCGIVGTEAKRFLVVDDDEGDARLIAEQLREVYGDKCEVKHIDDLDVAVGSLATNGAYDLVFMDINLGPGGREGLEGIRTVRSLKPHLPIVGYSHEADPRLVGECVDAGAQEFLSKGELEAGTLGRAIRYALERRRLQSEIESLRSGGPRPVPSPAEAAPVEAPAGLEQTYRAVLTGYIEFRRARKAEPTKETTRFARNPKQSIEAFAQQLASMRAGPRDLMMLHMRVLDRISKEMPGEQARAYALEGSFLALEMMGHLAEHYRSLAPPS